MSSESEGSQMDTSLYIPTPERYLHHVRELSKKQVRSSKPTCDLVSKVNVITLPRQVVFMDLSKLDEFVKNVRGCKTPECEGMGTQYWASRC